MRGFILVDGKLRETLDAAEIREAYEARQPLWVDVEVRTPEADALLGEVLKLHPLAIEDIWSDATVPKIESFDRYLYVLVNGLDYKRGSDKVTLRELDMVLGETFLVSHHTGPMAAINGVVDDLRRNPRLLTKGPAWVMHSLLDHLVDDFQPVMDTFDEELDVLEHDVIAKAGLPEGRDLLQRIFNLKHSLQGLRRSSMYQRELLLRLSRGEFVAVPRELIPFFRDVFDHFARFSDLAEGYRDLVNSALDAYLSVQSNRMNEVMKTLTTISTVMLPLTFIAGVYGMNFKHMPELEWHAGYPFAITLMILVAAGILLVFRRRGWI
ncbi:MAG TPA: magnesium/cobalt transporter CorA [Myxococcaceae bacterium]|nr:magnesium/cobalt transporter CorA [Myxococcaceae bacterium]